MIDKQTIENMRENVKPIISYLLLNNSGSKEEGEQNSRDFENDFDEILDFAIVGLERVLSLMNIDTDKRELIDRRDAIEAVTDYIFLDVCGGMKPVEKCKAEATRILRDVQSCEEKTVDITDNK